MNRCFSPKPSGMVGIPGNFFYNLTSLSLLSSVFIEDFEK
jgi:hypothetical protein